jgi:hypothetical protein
MNTTPDGRVDGERTFTMPRQALNDAENLMIRIVQNPHVLQQLGWDPYGEVKIEASRRAISDAIAASDREHGL